jgi:putative Mn2+ efflux pump MntP
LDIISILLIAVGLAMDTFAVSIAHGISTKQNRKKTAILMASFFGGFQMLMPAIGYFAGLSLQELIMGVDHWIAFGLLAFIGAKMIHDTTKKEECKENKNLSIHSLLVLAIATSIDALMVGLSFAFIQTSILLPIAAIGIVTFLLSCAGFFFGCGLGHIFGNKIKITGGLILILIGIQILLEHLL